MMALPVVNEGENVYMRESHIDTARLQLTAELGQRIADRTSAPDANGCMIYQQGQTNAPTLVEVLTHDGERVFTHVNRAVFALNGGHVGEHEEIGHACSHTAKGDLCINQDHLVKQTPEASRRDARRKRHLQALRNTFTSRETHA